MYRFATAIGVDLARKSIRAAVIRHNGEVLHSETFPLKARQDREYILSELASGIKYVREKAAAGGVNPIAIGLAVSGFVDHENGTVLGPGHGIKNWKNIPLSRLLNRETALPVFVGNDANLMTIAEQKFGAANGFSNVIFVALRTGIGGGIIINGNLYRGVNNAGGEIGQMIINFEGGLSETGIKGSFEHYASASAMVTRYARDCGLDSKQAASLTAKDIFSLSYRKDPNAVKVVRENAYLVGLGLSNLITIFAPEIIVLGGGMAEARDSYISLIRKSAFSNSLENCRTEVKIERAALGRNSALIGAAYYSLTRLAGKNI